MRKGSRSGAQSGLFLFESRIANRPRIDHVRCRYRKVRLRYGGSWPHSLHGAANLARPLSEVTLRVCHKHHGGGKMVYRMDKRRPIFVHFEHNYAKFFTFVLAASILRLLLKPAQWLAMAVGG